MVHPLRVCTVAFLTGGSGKTTLADLMWNHFVNPSTYLGQSAPVVYHLAKLELGMDAGTTDLQASLKDALEQFKSEPIQSTKNIKQQLHRFVQTHKVLYVLDNITYADQLDTLLPREFAPGSIVIVTSRLKSLPLSNAQRQVGRAAAGPNYAPSACLVKWQPVDGGLQHGI
jgi:hypothetical protein